MLAANDRVAQRVGTLKATVMPFARQGLEQGVIGGAARWVLRRSDRCCEQRSGAGWRGLSTVRRPLRGMERTDEMYPGTICERVSCRPSKNGHACTVLPLEITYSLFEASRFTLAGPVPANA
jgi:hypothetical protein